MWNLCRKGLRQSKGDYLRKPWFAWFSYQWKNVCYSSVWQKQSVLLCGEPRRHKSPTKTAMTLISLHITWYPAFPVLYKVKPLEMLGTAFTGIKSCTQVIDSKISSSRPSLRLFKGSLKDLQTVLKLISPNSDNGCWKWRKNNIGLAINDIEVPWWECP